MRSHFTSLTSERLRGVLNYDPDTGVFTRKVRTTNTVNVGDVAGNLKLNGYRCISVDGNRYQAHRLAWLYVHGVWPEEQVDHINRMRDDNRIVNLRLASGAENQQNSSHRVDNTSGHKGIGWSKRHQQWRVRIQHQNRHIYLGLFVDINDAIAARKAAEAQLHPFAAK